MLSGKYAEAEAILIALNAEGYEGASEYLQYCRNQMGRVEATATPRTAEVSAKMNALFTVGNYVTFGHYPQTKNGNDSTPIEWAVLARDGSKALLLSRYGLEAQPYNQVSANVTWEDCTLRAWLNDTFLNCAFTQEEQTAILLTDVDNSRAQGYSSWATDGGSDTQDMVFLLSYADAQYYFGLVYGDKNNRMARTSPTPYALARGAWVSSDDPTYDGKYAAWWWLRSPGGEQNCAARVSPEGGLVGSSVSYTYTMIRPVIWVDLSSAVLQETAAAGTGTAVVEAINAALSAPATAEKATWVSVQAFGGEYIGVGVTDENGVITSFTIDASSQTPGLGQECASAAFTSQFIGKKAPFVLNENIDAVTSATITSQAVVDAVNSIYGY